MNEALVDAMLSMVGVTLQRKQPSALWSGSVGCNQSKQRGQDTAQRLREPRWVHLIASERPASHRYQLYCLPSVAIQILIQPLIISEAHLQLQTKRMQ